MALVADLDPLHEAEDPERLAELTASIRDNGWTGAPLVLLGGGTLLTGSHRYAAARACGLTDIPVVWVEDLVDWPDDFRGDRTDACELLEATVGYFMAEYLGIQY
jgi:hypothetical protein